MAGSEKSGEALAIILAAGLGKRMRSDIPKVMHPLGGIPLIRHVLATAGATTTRRAVVVGPGMDNLESEIKNQDPTATIHHQTERLGTAHAAGTARDAVSSDLDFIYVMFGDTPLMRSETVAAVGSALGEGPDVCVLGFRTEHPTGYGRLLTEGDRLLAIREEAAASEAEKTVRFCNSGVMGFRAEHFIDLVDAIGNDNPKQEFYLTDAVEIANERGLTVVAIAGDESEFLGINSRAQLADAEAVFQARKRREVMNNGATLIAPDTVFLAADTEIGRDVTIAPHVVFGPKVRVADNVTINAYCHIEDAAIGAGSTIGPFARLRPGTRTRENVKIGNFVEVKNAKIDAGTKVNHLTYIGDAEIGENVNVGAGTITCNYDGFNKHETVIGSGAFIGSNSALVAPVTVGEGAYVGSGSTVTTDVPKDALAVARGRQANKDGWARAFRKRFAK